ncbi:transglutaminase domain-containing protein [Thermodesulfobacteriota bacterium]
MGKDIMYWKNIKKIYGQAGHFCFHKNLKAWKLLPVFFLSIFIFLSGCASIYMPEVKKIPIDRFQPYEMPDGTKLFPGSADETIPDADILKINHEIKSLLDEKVVKIKNLDKRFNALIKIIVQKVNYDAIKDRFGVKTAQETFDTKTGNCLSFSNLFVAMARYSGFKTNFQEIPTLPNWTREKETLFMTKHIGTSVDIPARLNPVIQINIKGGLIGVDVDSGSDRFYFTPIYLDPMEPRLNPNFFRQITDDRAFAQFYNNIGSQRLAEGKDAEAFRYFVKAIKTDPELSYTWSNLGVVYRRNMQLDASEAAYLQGLAVIRSSRDISVMTIMNNLVNLYEIKGDTEKATFYENQVASFREKHPYYKYIAARTEFLDENYEMSIKRYKDAIRLKDDEHLFYYGLARAYQKTGNIEKAKKNIDKAIQYSWSNEKRIYYEKIRKELGSNTIN